MSEQTQKRAHEWLTPHATERTRQNTLFLYMEFRKHKFTIFVYTIE